MAKKLQVKAAPLKIDDPIPPKSDNIIVGAINRLAKVINDKDTKKEKEDHTQLFNRLDNIANAIANKPTNFQFDIRRDSQGYIHNVIVKPIKEK